MNILFLSNNKISDSLYFWLKNLEEDVLLFTEKISESFLKEYNPDFIISYNYEYIIMNELLIMYPNKFINLHTSYLPWNKGTKPNFWSFCYDTPKGVTIHYIDKGVDTGDILIQKEVFMSEDETLYTSYKKLNSEIQSLFMENWIKIKKNELVPIRQVEKGSINYIKDFEKVKKITEPSNWNISVKKLKENFENYKRENNT